MERQHKVKFGKKPVVVEATQWFKLGDHPEVENVERTVHTDSIMCKECNHKLHRHGKIETCKGLHIVCPGDWIIKSDEGEYFLCKPDVYKRLGLDVGKEVYFYSETEKESVDRWKGKGRAK